MTSWEGTATSEDIFYGTYVISRLRWSLWHGACHRTQDSQVQTRPRTIYFSWHVKEPYERALKAKFSGYVSPASLLDGSARKNRQRTVGRIRADHKLYEAVGLPPPAHKLLTRLKVPSSLEYRTAAIDATKPIKLIMCREILHGSQRHTCSTQPQHAMFMHF